MKNEEQAGSYIPGLGFIYDDEPEEAVKENNSFSVSVDDIDVPNDDKLMSFVTGPQKESVEHSSVDDNKATPVLTTNQNGAEPNNSDFVNKVVDDHGNILIDLTDDNVSPANVAYGIKFHNRRGEQKIGMKDAPIYGVKFASGSNTSGVTRLYMAEGKVAGVNGVHNDFDNIYPWSARKRCNVSISSNNKVSVVAYKGDANYLDDGSTGVYVEHSLFYYKRTYNAYTGEEEVLISSDNLDGYSPAPLFVGMNGVVHDKAYTAAYPITYGKNTPSAVSSDDMMESVSGGAIATESFSTFNSKYFVDQYLEGFKERFTEYLYMVVEFATRDMQTKMEGISNGSGNLVATTVGYGFNNLVVDASFSNSHRLTKGMTLWNEDYTKYCILTSDISYGTNPGGSPAFNLYVENPYNISGNLYIGGAATGTTKDILYSSGTAPSGGTGYGSQRDCVYRGKEMPYGNYEQMVGDVLVDGNGILYYNPRNPVPTGLQVVPTGSGSKYPSGYVFDDEKPYIFVPMDNSAGSSSTYYSDGSHIYLRNVGDTPSNVIAIGGHAEADNYIAGPWRFYMNQNYLAADHDVCARIGVRYAD